MVRGSHVLVTQTLPARSTRVWDMVAPDGFVYVKVKLGVSDSDYTQVVSGLTAQDTVGYDPSSVSSDTYYDNGGYEYDRRHHRHDGRRDHRRHGRWGRCRAP